MNNYLFQPWVRHLLITGIVSFSGYILADQIAWNAAEKKFSRPLIVQKDKMHDERLSQKKIEIQNRIEAEIIRLTEAKNAHQEKTN